MIKDIRGTIEKRFPDSKLRGGKRSNHFITKVLKLGSAKKVLDYGAGRGLHVNLWEKTFPEAELHFCDISPVAMEKFSAKFPQYADRFYVIHDDQTACDDNSFDVVVSVEVMEHVEDLDAYLSSISRLVKPGGYFIWTTPCGNLFSLPTHIQCLYG